MTAAAPTRRAITARNREIHKIADRYLRDGLLNPMERLCFTIILNLTGEHEYTDARRETIAQRMAGRSQAERTLGVKCLSSIKNYLRKLVDLGLIWIARGRIWIAALVAHPEAEATEVEQRSLFEEQPKNCPESDKKLSASPIKDSDLNSAGGGGEIDSDIITAVDVPETPAVAELRAGGTIVPAVLHELKDAAVDLVQRCRRQVQRTRHVNDPGAMLAYLVRAGVGADLDRSAPDTPPGSSVASGRAVAPLYAELWQTVASQLPVETWVLDSAQLLHLDDTRAVVGVANIFAREKLDLLLDQLTAAIVGQLGRSVAVEIAIGSGPL